MRLICGWCSRAVWLQSLDIEVINVDEDDDVTCPYCDTQTLTAALPPQERCLRTGGT